MAYFTETELESIMVKSFTSATPITSTQIGTLATEISAKLDGLVQQAEGSYGTDTTCEQWVKQACLAAASYKVNCIYAGEFVDEIKLIRIMKEVIKSKKPRSKFSVRSPDSSGEW